ncbi:hypothetical protein [Clostridium butyricum]
MDKIPWVTILISAMTAIIAYYSSQQKKGETLQEKYFNEVLLKYFEEKATDPNLDIKKFISGYKYKNICIPSYMFYLSDNTDIRTDVTNKELLEKIIVFDYWSNYPGLFNDNDRTVNKISKIVLFIEELFMAVTISISVCILITLVLVVIVQILPELIVKNFDNVWNILKEYLLLILGITVVSGIMFILNKIVKKGNSTLDIYTNDIAEIKKIIDKKYNKYMEIESNMYI